jgi:hypothetical protein
MLPSTVTDRMTTAARRGYEDGLSGAVSKADTYARGTQDKLDYEQFYNAGSNERRNLCSEKSSRRPY